MTTIFMDHRVTIADGLAIEEVCLNKGHAGSVPCAICRNITDAKRGYHLKPEAGGRVLPTTSLALK